MRAERLRAGRVAPIALLCAGRSDDDSIDRPILAVGADLKNSITLTGKRKAFVSQQIGDLDHYESLRSFQQTIKDLVSMYEVDGHDLLVVHGRSFSLCVDGELRARRVSLKSGRMC